MKMISWQDYQATFRNIRESQTPEDLMKLNVRVQRQADKSPMLLFLLKGLIEGRRKLLEEKNKKIEREEDITKWTTEFLAVALGMHSMEGALAMLLTLAESSQDEDEVGRLKLRLKFLHDNLDQAEKDGLIVFPHPESLSLQSLLETIKQGSPLESQKR